MLLISTGCGWEVGNFWELRYAWVGDEELYVLFWKYDWRETDFTEP